MVPRCPYHGTIEPSQFPVCSFSTCLSGLCGRYPSIVRRSSAPLRSLTSSLSLERLSRRYDSTTRPANSTFMSCHCRGRLPIARRRRIERAVEPAIANVRAGHSPLSSTASGLNTNGASRPTAKCRRRGSRARSSTKCSILCRVRVWSSTNGTDTAHALAFRRKPILVWCAQRGAL